VTQSVCSNCARKAPRAPPASSTASSPRETGDPKLEPYCVTASKILKREVTPADEAGRQIGKVCDLAFGFGGGLSAWRRFDASGTYTAAEIESFKAQWRNTHVATVRFWRALEDGLRRALRTKQRLTLGNIAAEVIGGVLYLTLPSGRRLAYPQARLVRGKHPGTVQIVFKDNARCGWSDQRGWHGVFVENVVQAIARDLLAAAMLRIEAAGYPVVLHVHDEIVCEVPEGFGSSNEFLRLMTTLPVWAAGLPIAAKVWTRACYAKPQPAPAPLPLVETEKPAPKVNGHALRKRIEKIIAPIETEHGHVPLADLIGQPLVDGKIICPFHDDNRPSLHVYPDHFHCFACGAHGDHVDWLMMVERKTREEAERVIETWEGPPVQQRRPRKDDNERTLALAARIWEKARPIAGSLAVKYLAEVRKIDVDALPKNIDDALRFHPGVPFGPGVRAPCLIALYRDAETNELAGIHRLALKPDVFQGAKVQRRMLGCWPKPRAVKLWPAGDQLYLGEGIETTLAAATRITHQGAPMRPAWATGVAGNMGCFPVVEGVKQLVILADNDSNGTGQNAAEECARRWHDAKRDAICLMPPEADTDFNDLVRAL